MKPSALSRRQFLIVSGGMLTLAACGNRSDSSAPQRVTVKPDDPAVADAESRRSRRDAPVVRAALTAAPMTVDLAGRAVSTWGYSNVVPGPLLRAKVGDVLEVALRNQLTAPTSIHWHGLALRNDMDGVPDVTQASVPPGGDFTYRFALAHPGTYWFHPHEGLQLDRGLYAALIVDDPNDPGRYDAEHVLVLDDWLDGFGPDPDQILADLQNGTGMAGMDHGGGSMPGMSHPMAMRGGGSQARAVALGEPDHPTTVTTIAPGAAMGRFSSPALGGDAGDVAYAAHIVNGRPPQDRPTFDAPPGGRVRLRVINAGSDTAYRFAIGGHRLTVTHTDGYAIDPVDVDAVIIGMGERYDVVVTAMSGAWPIVASAEGKGDAAVAVLRTTDAAGSSPPPPDARPTELTGQLLDYGALRAASAVRLDGAPDITVDLDLNGDMMRYRWSLDRAGGSGPIEISAGQRVRVNLRNRSTMWHPIHLHGHTFALATHTGGARKDTLNVLPGQSLPIDFVADNPGQWMLHCHNTYHLVAGMSAVVSYVRG